MKKLELKERLPAFVESLQTNGYKPEIGVKNHKITLTIETESYKQAMEVAGCCVQDVKQDLNSKRKEGG